MDILYINVNFIAELTVEQFREYYLTKIEEWLSQPFTILAHCNLEICDLINGTKRIVDVHQKKPLKFEEDYGESKFPK